ncbi:MAG TPA: DNA/RNA nuclease SfsA, partial [bacterium]|nr:DNA/RNA nuclease SfsA [bacterium]
MTKRGTKHLHELMRMVEEGHHAVIIFFVNREDGKVFSPAALIDPAYAHALREAHKAGVKIIP